MTRSPLRTLPLALLLAAGPAAAADDAPGTESATATEKSRTRYEYAVKAAAGYFDGMGVRTDSGGIALVELDLTPKLQLGKWQLDFPLRLDHQQTFGADLSETVAGAEFDAMRRSSDRMRFGPIGGVSYTRRAGWPDLYQPDGSGGLLTTDRFSHLDWYAGWQHWYTLGDKRNLRWKIRYVQSDYKDDPNFNVNDTTPTHLVPRDNKQLKFDTSYRTIREHFAYAVRFDAWYRWDSIAIARVANTGAATTDLQKLWGVEPSVELELRLAPVSVAVEYAWLKQVDPVTGYYTYAGHHPTVKAEVALGKRASLQARADAWLITYGPDAKDTTENGQRLATHKYALKGSARYRLVKDLALVAEAEWTARDTNYCDYQATAVGNCPASSYAIDWDYTNVMATAGVEWKP